jgi:erythromycin esterase
MKNIKTFLLCLIGILASHPIMLAQNQYPKKYNLNFDHDKQSMPEGWFKWGNLEKSSGEITAEKMSNGNGVGKVTSTDKSKFGCITYKIPANYVGDSITLTGRIKHEKVDKSVGLVMRIDGFNGSLAFKNMQRYKIKGTNNWKEYSITLPYPTGAEAIYVGGIVDGKGTAWFDDFVITIDGKDIQTMTETPKIYLKNYNTADLNTAIQIASTALDLSTNESLSFSLDALIAKVGDKKIVSIGESTHGTAEFYRLREMITKRLILEKGFKMVILESPYDDIELLNKDLMTSSIESLIQKHLFSIYQTKEMKSFLQWYKENRSNYNIQFKGCDDSYWAFYELLSENVKGIKDEKLVTLVQKLKSNSAKTTGSFEAELKNSLANYNTILEIENQLESTGNLTASLKEILFNGKNTHINYVNRKNGKQNQSRDEIMADRISYLAHNSDSKIIVWAHNAHISNEIITDNEIGIMGRNLKQEFKNDYHSIGLTTLKGSYSFIDERFINGDHFYIDELKKTTMQSTETNLWENSLTLNGKSFYLDMPTLTKELKTDGIIGLTKLIGYGKETNKDIYQLPLIKLFDSLIFIENTNATTPLYQ